MFQVYDTLALEGTRSHRTVITEATASRAGEGASWFLAVCVTVALQVFLQAGEKLKRRAEATGFGFF